MKLNHRSDNNFSYQPIMTKIANLFDVTLYSIFRPKSEFWCVSVNSLNKIENVINNFYYYPLFSSKYLDYKDWCKVYYIIFNKEHFYFSDLLKIIYIRSNMNSYRTFMEKNKTA
jgi:LAGLIDADG endonuclease